jgi:hypothetical protein
MFRLPRCPEGSWFGFDDFGRQFLRQPFAEARAGRQALRAAVLDVFGGERPRVARLAQSDG